MEKKLTPYEECRKRAAEGDKEAQEKLKGYEEFEEKVREVARDFFAMSEEEQEAMKKYAAERCEEARQSAAKGKKKP